MKKLLMAAAVLLSLCAPRWAFADPQVLFDFGGLRFYIPLTSLEAVYQYDFVGKRNLVGGETTVAGWKKLTGTFGAVTSLDGQGSPFVGAHYLFDNPIPQWAYLADLKPGVFVGRDFRNRATIFGLKVSKPLF